MLSILLLVQVLSQKTHHEAFHRPVYHHMHIDDRWLRVRLYHYTEKCWLIVKFSKLFRLKYKICLLLEQKREEVCLRLIFNNDFFWTWVTCAPASIKPAQIPGIRTMIHSNQNSLISGMTIRQAANPQVDIVKPISGLRTLKTFVAEAAPMKKAIERTVKIFQGVTIINLVFTIINLVF